MLPAIAHNLSITSPSIERIFFNSALTLEEAGAGLAGAFFTIAGLGAAFLAGAGLAGAFLGAAFAFSTARSGEVAKASSFARADGVRLRPGLFARSASIDTGGGARILTFLPGESDFLPGFFAGAFFKIVFWGGSALALIAGLGGGGAGFFGAALGGALSSARAP